MHASGLPAKNRENQNEKVECEPTNHYKWRRFRSRRQQGVRKMDTEGEEFDELQAEAHVCNTMFSYMKSLALKCAIQLGIPDIIHSHGQPMTLQELAAALPIHPNKTTYLHRLMRLLVHSGYFRKQILKEEDEGEKVLFSLTSPSKVLLKQRATNISPFLLVMLEPYMTDPWHHLSSWLQGKDETPFETVHESPFWYYAEQHPEGSSLINKAMASDTEVVMKILIRDCGELFRQLRSFVDVGGGFGRAAMAVAKAFPHVNCMVLDIPQVVSALPKNSTVHFIAGNMFENIPSANAAFLKGILHNWSDEDCVKILKLCKEAIPGEEEGGKVILVEMVINPDDAGDHKSVETQLFFDLLMMELTGGKERSEKEWEKIFLSAGFTRYKITPVLGLRSVIEVYP